MNTVLNRMTKLLTCIFMLLMAGTLAACLAAPEPEAAPEPAPIEVPAQTQDEKNTTTYDSGLMVMDGYAAESGEYGYWIEDPINWNTEEYGVIREGGFISVRSNPLSTLSADVDTASYANLRRMVFDGYDVDEIPSGAVRIEEMLNYFTYNYAQPAAGERFSVTAHLGPCPWNPETRLLTLGFATAREDSASLRGRNLVFLIDVSGSMDSREKLDLLKDAFEVLVRELGPEDRISIVTYASGEELVLEGAHGDEARTIMRAINRLEAGGATNGERGLELAYEVAERNYIDGGVNRIIMASDGDLNVGMTSESDLYDYVSAKRETGIYLSVLGFGTGNYKDTKMETLADNGNGSYHYIDCIDEAERVFSQNLSANLVPFADDVKVQVEFNPELVKAYRLIGYENREMADEDFTNDEKDAADVGPNAQFTVAYEIVPADSAMEVSEPELRYSTPAAPERVHCYDSELAQVSLRYRAFDDGQVHEQNMQIADEDSMDADWRFAAAVIEFGMYLRDSEYAGTTSPESIVELISASEPTAEHDGFAELVGYLLEGDPGYLRVDTVK